jgi:hypothetical protein
MPLTPMKLNVHEFGFGRITLKIKFSYFVCSTTPCPGALKKAFSLYC